MGGLDVYSGAYRRDLVGELNRGWTVGKRLLQHERSGITTLAGGGPRNVGPKLIDVAKQYLGEQNGKLADADYRSRIVQHQMNARSLQLTQKQKSLRVCMQSLT